MKNSYFLWIIEITELYPEDEVKPDKPLKTNRMIIRSYTAKDKQFCLSLWCDKENGKYMSDPETGDADKKYLSLIDEMEKCEDGYYFIAELKDDAIPVGTCCAFPEGKNYDIGYCISKEYWKQGLGTEMISELIKWIASQGGASVTCEVADDNAASLALLKKFGFIKDGKSKYKKRGTDIYFDAHYYRLDLGSGL